MKDLILITCYFGKFPNYFDLFLKSCSWNPFIDWLIVTDDHSSHNFPPNVKIQYSTLEKIERIAKEKIGNWIQLKRPYKLCDFKTTYGILFQKDISEYRYWGHCDIDVVWSEELSNIVLPLLNYNYSRIFKYGHLSIFKNNPTTNNLFKLNYSGINYKTALSSNISCGFDEQKGTWQLALENGINCYHEDICFDIKRPSPDKQLKSYTSENYNEQCFIIENRHLYQYFKDYNGTIQHIERAYIHFQQRNPIFNQANNEAHILQLTQNQFVKLELNWDINNAFERNRQKITFLENFKQQIKQYKQTFKFQFLKHQLIK